MGVLIGEEILCNTFYMFYQYIGLSLLFCEIPVPCPFIPYSIFLFLGCLQGSAYTRFSFLVSLMIGPGPDSCKANTPPTKQFL